MAGRELGSVGVGQPADMALHLYRAEAHGHMYYALAPTAELAEAIIRQVLTDEGLHDVVLEMKAYRDQRPIRAVAIKSPDSVGQAGMDFLETHVALGFEVAENG